MERITIDVLTETSRRAGVAVDCRTRRIKFCSYALSHRIRRAAHETVTAEDRRDTRHDFADWGGAGAAGQRRNSRVDRPRMEDYSG